jgi:hypothetical protein
MTPGRALVNSSEETISGKRVNICQEQGLRRLAIKFPPKKKEWPSSTCIESFFHFNLKKSLQ